MFNEIRQGHTQHDAIPSIENLDGKTRINTIVFADDSGTGFMKNIFIEEDFQARYFSVYFNRPVEAKRLIAPDEYKYVLTFDISAIPNSPNEPVHFFNSSKISFCAGDMLKDIHLEVGKKFRSICILIRKDWLKNNFPDGSEFIEKALQEKSIKSLPPCFTQDMDVQQRIRATLLANEMDTKSFPLLHVKTACFILLNHFLINLYDLRRNKVICEASAYLDTMLKIEAIIAESVLTKLPRLEDLATQAGLSLSTLKRHFRMVFGKNIYECYQEKRMLWVSSSWKKEMFPLLK